jgi:hypothetical protein
MHTSLASPLGIGLLLMALTVRAEITDPDDIPQKVTQNIFKRHPAASDLHASHEIHFGQHLLEVGYKNQSGQTIQELFTEQGHLFTNELLIEDLAEIYPAVLAALNREFPQHRINKAELIGNPNGIGEEYDIYLTANGTDWKVSISDQGLIQDKHTDKTP